MLKGKYTKHILFPIVILIWGTVIYKLLFSSPDASITSNPLSLSTVEFSQEVEEADSFTLLLNYRDPFLGKPARAKSPRTRSNSTKPKSPVKKLPEKTPPPPPQKTTDWSFIKYHGYTAQTDKEVGDAIVTIKGSTYHVDQGKSYAGVDIVKVYRDSLRVRYSGEYKTIRIR